MRWSTDRLGMVASTLCALHCTVSPFVFVILPWLESIRGFWVRDLERGLIGVAVGLASLAFTVGYRTHRNGKVGLCFLSGFSLIGLGHWILSDLTEWGETVLVVAGTGLLIIGHAWNQRLCRCKECTSCKTRFTPTPI